MLRCALGLGTAVGLTLALAQPAWAVEFERVVIDDAFPGAYQVEVADVNGDGKPDVVAVGGGTCAWYENPKWTKEVLAGPKLTPGIISSATADAEGRGRAQVALAYEFAMNQPAKGELLFLRQSVSDKPPLSVTAVGHIGSIHRLRWGDLDGDKRLDLVIAPIFGPSAKPPAFNQEGATVLAYRKRVDDTTIDFREAEKVGVAPVLHAIDVVDIDEDGRADVLTASNLGVTRMNLGKDETWISTPLVPGAPGESPKRGSSEVHVGRLRDGRKFVATIDPWHGSQVAVCLAERPGSLVFGPRTVIDDTLADGHALWVADVDDDGDSEIFAGHRGADHRVSVYDFDGKAWNRTVLDRAIAAQDLRGGDLDGDGTPDVVAVGGSTHNVVWYRMRRNNRTGRR
ncbi:MAG: VCBS repeat-containing protein [Isosphaeraceae bacterium]|nr:VCBS repeat-containing protein [Isosphaeraceae bacterium]